MAAKIENLVSRWLHQLKISVSNKYIKEKLLSHPDYPSILSITDILDDLGIENAAIVVDKEKLHEIPVPFLANTSEKGTDFIIVSDIQKILKKQPAFIQQWDGVAIVAEKSSISDPQNEKWLSSDKRTLRSSWIAVLLITVLVGVAISAQFSWLLTALMITAMAGLTVTFLIVQHELGISNNITEQLCSAGKNSDCDAVLHSKRSKLVDWLNFADIGIIWFSSQFLIVAISLFTVTIKSVLPFIALLSIAALPFTFFSLYYQWRIVKKWCPLCLITAAILWLQFLILIPEIIGINFNSFSPNASGLIMLVAIFITVSWLLLLRPALSSNKEIKDKNFRLQRFKYNSRVFETLLHLKPQIDTASWIDDLQLGDPDSAVQIMVACNPYCGPCARAHEVLHELAEKKGIGLTVRFGIKINKADKKTEVVEYLLQLLMNKPASYKRKALHAWYVDMNMEKFEKDYLLKDKINVDELMKQHEAWAEKAEIKFTPAIFINGYQLPKPYSANDLPILISGLLSRKEKAEEKVDEDQLMPI